MRSSLLQFEEILLLLLTILIVECILVGTAAADSSDLPNTIKPSDPAISIRSSTIVEGPDSGEVLQAGSIVVCGKLQEDRIWISVPRVGWMKKDDFLSLRQGKEYWKQQTTNQPVDMTSYQTLADLQMRCGEFDEASATLSEARKLDPNDPDIQALALAMRVLTEGVTTTNADIKSICSDRNLDEYSATLLLECLLMVDDEELFKLVLDSVQIDQKTSNANLLLYKAKRVYWEGEYRQALDLITAILDRDPWCTAAYHARAKIFRDQGRFTEAIQDLQTRVQLMPDDQVALRQLATTYGESGDKQKEISKLKQALNIAPNDASTVFRLGIALMMECAIKGTYINDADSMKESVVMLKKACELTDYRNKLYVRELCGAYVLARQTDQAKKIIESGIAKCEKDSEERRYLEETLLIVEQADAVQSQLIKIR